MYAPKIELVGDESEHYNDFLELIDSNDSLAELSSIKLRNIYSICLTDRIKEIILDDIFGAGSDSNLIRKETKIELGIMDPDEKDRIKEILEQLLSIVIRTDLRNKLLAKDQSQVSLVVPCQVLMFPELLDELKISLDEDTKFTTWKSLDYSMQEIIFLDYRDPGHRLFSIYPNIIEVRFNPGQIVKGVFLNMFFKKNFAFSQYSYHQFLIERILNHPFRHERFNWDNLILKLRSNKPEERYYDHLWDLDNEYESSSEHISIFVEFGNKSYRSFYPTQLIVAKDENEDHLFTLRAEELLNKEENSNLVFQPLEALYEDLNLFTVTNEEEVEIQRLKEHYGIGVNQTDVRLWKVLLKRRSEEMGVDKLFQNLEPLVVSERVTLVSKQYFINEWLNPRSPSLIPRTKKMFKVLCDYLELPNVYFRVMLKKRAKERTMNRRSNSRMNALFVHLIKLGAFEVSDDLDKNSIWSEISTSHDLEDIGITSANQNAELSALVELSKANLKMERISNVQIRKS